MIQKAKELLKFKTTKQEQKTNSLFKEREEAIKKPYSNKLNFNLVFNQAEYKSQKDNPSVLAQRKSNIIKIINQPVIDLKQLKRCAWNGVETHRDIVWKVLLGYLSIHKDKHKQQRQKHLKEYQELVRDKDPSSSKVKKLIQIDIPRTFFEIEIIFGEKKIQSMLERILCLWDITSSGYTQGMGDIAGLILMILTKYDTDPKQHWFKSLKQDELQMIEADLYWLCRIVCSKFFEYYNISNYKGIQKAMIRISGIIQKSDIFLSNHLKQYDISIFQFAFRWIYVLLSRELPINLVFRLMDSYFSASQQFEILHSYVAASLILRFSVDLLKINSFHGIMTMLQNLPTDNWTKKDIQMLVQQAVVLMNTYSNIN